MLSNVLTGIFSAAFLGSILRVATPILLPSLGALIAEDAGAINVALEGTMLASAFAGVIVSAYGHMYWGLNQPLSMWLGGLAGLSISLVLGLVLAFFYLNLNGDVILCGMAINILSSGGTVALLYQLTGDRGNTSTLASLAMPFVQMPFLENWGPIGQAIYDIIGNQSALTWLSWLLIAAVWFFVGMCLGSRAESGNQSLAV